MATAIEFDHVGKQYRLGLVSTRTLSHDLNRWWQMAVLKKEDPYLKIGETNDRSTFGTSEYVWALRDIDFKIEQGDVVGIIGKNGAGKSTLLKLLSKVTGPTVGTISARGRIGSLLEVGTGFHREMTGRENIFMNGAILGMTKADIKLKLDEIISFSGCERYLDTPVKRYSSGMTVRLGFAVAAFLDPEILVVDEVLAVGDAEFQKKAIGKMQDVAEGEGRTVLFVSHNMSAVKNLCKRGILLDKGQVSFMGTADETISEYLIGNSAVLGTSLKERLDKKGNRKIEIEGITFRDSKGVDCNQVFSGEPMSIEFEIKKNEEVDLSKLIVACSFSDSFGTPHVLWVSDEMNHSFEHLDTRLILRIDSLSLRPNNYNFNYQFSIGSTSSRDFCDALTNAAILTVLGNNTFSNDIIVKREGYGALLKASFSIE